MNDIIPPVLAQLGTAVVILYLSLQIVKVGREFAGKGHRPAEREEENGTDLRTEYRLNKLDEEMKERITRTEYESRHADMLRSLQRMEAKLDQLIGIRKLFTGREDAP